MLCVIGARLLKGQVMSATLLANIGVSPERTGTSVGQCPGQEFGIHMTGDPGQAPCGAVNSVKGLSVTRPGDSRIGWCSSMTPHRCAGRHLKGCLSAPQGELFCTHGVGIDPGVVRGRNPLPPTHIGKDT